MEFSTQTTASLHQVKTAALAVGVFTEGELTAEAESLDVASDGAIRSITKTEFKGKAGSTLVLRNLPGVAAARVVLVTWRAEGGFSAAWRQW